MKDRPVGGVFRKQVPEGVVEITGLPTRGGIVERKDGSLMLAAGQSRFVSTDGGCIWGDERPLDCPIPIEGLIRLRSGALGAYATKDDGRYFASSVDEGKTWSEPSLVCPAGAGNPLAHSMVQLGTGRLLLAMYVGVHQGLSSWEYRDGTMVSVHPNLQYEDVSAYGVWRGERIQIEGHAHGPEMGISVVYRCDDEGKTWTKHVGGLMGWFDFEGIPNGHCGNTGCLEPTIAETRDGNVLLVGRATVGRLVQSVSTDGGEQWSAVLPTDLPSSESPAVMVRLPESGDLLIVWNQVSREEIRRGYRRGRLSSAISKDGGHSWEHFKTLELSEGLEDIDRLPPEYPIQMVRARDWVGVIPDSWAFFHYANIDVVGDQVFLRYSRGTPLLGVAEQKLKKQQGVLRVYPVEWFYE